MNPAQCAAIPRKLLGLQTVSKKSASTCGLIVPQCQGILTKVKAPFGFIIRHSNTDLAHYLLPRYWASEAKSETLLVAGIRCSERREPQFQRHTTIGATGRNAQGSRREERLQAAHSRTDSPHVP